MGSQQYKQSLFGKLQGFGFAFLIVVFDYHHDCYWRGPATTELHVITSSLALFQGLRLPSIKVPGVLLQEHVDMSANLSLDDASSLWELLLRSRTLDNSPKISAPLLNVSAQQKVPRYSDAYDATGPMIGAYGCDCHLVEMLSTWGPSTGLQGPALAGASIGGAGAGGNPAGAPKASPDPSSNALQALPDLPGDVGLPAAEWRAEEFAELARLHGVWGSVEMEPWHLGSECLNSEILFECWALPQDGHKTGCFLIQKS